ncbi:MAG: AAA family ATPase [Flavobacteriales bacterium]|nr:AAA family ATPase [Flavobacteriales bacterium]
MSLPKIAIVGPESSGKTTLSDELMMRIGGGRVSDGTRELLEELDRPYVEDDLLQLARSQAQWFEDAPQFAMEHWAAVSSDDRFESNAPMEPVYFDCDILNIKIWSQEKFGRVSGDRALGARTPLRPALALPPGYPFGSPIRFARIRTTRSALRNMGA